MCRGDVPWRFGCAASHATRGRSCSDVDATSATVHPIKSSWPSDRAGDHLYAFGDTPVDSACRLCQGHVFPAVPDSGDTCNCPAHVPVMMLNHYVMMPGHFVMCLGITIQWFSIMTAAATADIMRRPGNTGAHVASHRTLAVGMSGNVRSGHRYRDCLLRHDLYYLHLHVPLPGVSV